MEQIKILSNYYHAIENAFPDVYNPKEGASIFFKTLGFGAMMNVLPTVVDLTLKLHKSFRVEFIVQVFKKVDDFQFEDWESLGTGSDAENAAAEDFRVKLRERVDEESSGQGTVIDL